MAILYLKNGAMAGAKLVLREGPSRIGRAEGNDHVIGDPSISSFHCEVKSDGHRLTLRDLGSTNGTLVRNQRVSEALLEAGETFLLGDVECVFQTEAEASAPPLVKPVVSIPQPTLRIGSQHAIPSPVQNATEVAAGEIPVPAVNGDMCGRHPVSRAKHTCTRCRIDLCEQCVRLEKIGPKSMPFCRHCGARCVPVGQAISPGEAKEKTFSAYLAGAFTYPFKGNGTLLLIVGTIFFGFLDFMSGFSILFIRVLTYGYLFAYMQKIISASAMGEDDPPGFPEVSELYSDVVQPFFLLMTCLLVSFAPAYFIYSQGNAAAGLFLLVVGLVYFPMALLAVAMADSVSGLNPLIVFSAIIKVPGPYVVACVMLGGLFLARAFLPTILGELPIPLLPQVLVSFSSLLLLVIEMRILGSLYYTNRQRIGWF